MKYEEYRHAKGAQKKAIRQGLIAYNRDDLEALTEVANRVRELTKNAEPIILPRTRKAKHRTASRNGQAGQHPRGEHAWDRHLKSCDACMSAARGQDSVISFCSVGLALMDEIGA